MGYFRKFVNGYRTLAVMAFNIFVFFMILNIVLMITFAIMDNMTGGTNPLFLKYGREAFKEIYPGLTYDEINGLLLETWTRPRTYEAYTQLKERPYAGKYVNVDKSGFRFSKNQGPWPPDRCSLNVFVFGGSTTFNYGVSDDQTIASYLQDYLSAKLKKDVRVYNFGRGNYYSTQERILFQQLLISGFIPDAAIFIDGLNEFYYNADRPVYTDRITELVDRAADEKISAGDFSFLRKLPIVRAVDSIKYRSGLIFKASAKAPGTDESAYSDERVTQKVIKRYAENKKIIEAISDAYGVRCVFVWQPAPFYMYDLKHHLFVPRGGWAGNTYSKYGYPRMADFIKEDPLGEDFLWCADIQNGLEAPLYVDAVHYAPALSEKLAQAIGEMLISRDLLTQQREVE